MPIDKNELEKKFNKLSTRYGGSVLVERQYLKQDDVTLFFGLGGLGGRAVNAIKATANEYLTDADKRFYVVCDTCLKDMEKISVVTAADAADIVKLDQAETPHGSITGDEKIQLYDKAHPFKIENLDISVDSWLDRKIFNKVTIDGKGAQGIRQMGRVMLMGNSESFNMVKNKVSEKIDDAYAKAQLIHKELKVYIIAGIGGGTGSGTIVDFSYIVRELLAAYGNADIKVEGILFCHDVQMDDEGIRGKAAAIHSIERNFYAAIKEIDYFYNNCARNKKYVSPIEGENTAFEKDIFDECTLVSRFSSDRKIAENSDELLDKFAKAIVYEIADVGLIGKNGTAMSYSSYYSNIAGHIAVWKASGTGMGMNIPDWAPLRYSSLGFSSFYVPRDEILAYCANLLIEQLKKQWDSNNITDDEITKILHKRSLDTSRNFAEKLFDLSECTEPFNVDDDELPADGFALLPVKNCKSYLDMMRKTAIEEAEARKIKVYYGKARQSLDSFFVAPLIQLVDKAFTDSENGRGPSYAIDLLSRDNPYGAKGILVRLRTMLESLGNEATVWEEELKIVHDDLAKKADSYDGKLKIDKENLKNYTEDCRAYGENLFKAKLLRSSTDYLTEIYTKLNDKNHNVFSVYTVTLQYLVDILSKDSQYVTNTNRKRVGHTTIFSFNVANFEDNDIRSKRFKAFFKGFIDNKDINEQSKFFINSIFAKLKNILDPAVKDGTQPKAVSENDVIDVVREYFSDFFRDWSNDIIEKFCVIAYSQIDITPDQLTAIWGDPDKRDAVLQAAANEISTTLNQDSAIMLTSSAPGRNVENYLNYTSVAVLQNTPDINNKMDYTGTIAAAWPEFFRYKRVFGLPLCFLKDLNTCKDEYDKSTVPGLHLVEVRGGNDWTHSLPEPFSYNVARFTNTYTADGNDRTEDDYKHMQNILSMAESAERLGVLELIKGNPQNPNDTESDYYKLKWKLLRPIDVTAEKDNMYNNMKTVIESNTERGVDNSFIAVMESAGYRIDTPTVINWYFANPAYNMIKNCTAFGDKIVFGNFITLIRSNPEWESELKQSIELFGASRDIYETVLSDIAIAQRYEDRFKLFIRALTACMISDYIDPKTNEKSGYQLIYGDRRDENAFIDNTGWSFYDKKYILYRFFVDVILKLTDEEYHTFGETLNEKERDSVYVKECRNNSFPGDICREAEKVIFDTDFLGDRNEERRRRTFKESLEGARFDYNVPSPSNGNKDTDAVISNLCRFYTNLSSRLKTELGIE